MEQLYMLEIFIDKLSILLKADDPDAHVNKEFIIIAKFGPKVQFIFKNNQLALQSRREEIVETEKVGYSMLIRTVRVGKSYVFPAYADTMLMTLNRYPLAFELWTDDLNELGELIGIGYMVWDTDFIFMLKESTNSCLTYPPLSMKVNTSIDLQCCCTKIGELDFILRLNVFGDSVIADFRQLVYSDPNAFHFRTNKAPSVFQCKIIEPDDPQYNHFRSLYDIEMNDDPDVIADANKMIDVCSALQSCGITGPGKSAECQSKAKALSERKPKKYPIDRIRLGDITGPCGNANCPLSHQIKTYIRHMHGYKVNTMDREFPKKEYNPKTLRRVCGKCACKHDEDHRDSYITNKANTITKTPCPDCGGMAQAGETCAERLANLFGTGVTPKGSKEKIKYVVNYLTSVILDRDRRTLQKDFLVYPCEIRHKEKVALHVAPQKKCSCGKRDLSDRGVETDAPLTKNMASGHNPTIYNVSQGTSQDYKFCLDIPDEKDKDCKCNPPFLPPPCNALDCECISKAEQVDSRKRHKPYCPSYMHKLTCPVTKKQDEENEEQEEEKEEVEPLPYGLPPVQLGPCPVLARPCTVPDGFNRMYRTAAMPQQPPSWSDAGKVCCSKEYERIKKALKEFLDDGKKDDYRCVNKFNVDTERRCCDKEQRLLSLLGKSCCGKHKIEIQDIYKEKQEREASEKRNAERANK